MKLPLRFPALVLFLGLSALPGASQESPPKAAGEAALKGGFRAYIAYDRRFDEKDDKSKDGKSREDKLHCPVCENGLNPVVAVFSRTIPKDAAAPLLAVVKLQDALVKKYAQQKLGAFAIFLALSQLYEDDPTRIARTEDIKALANQLKLRGVPLGLAEATVQEGDKLAPPEKVRNYGITADDDITVIFYDRLKVVERWSYPADKGPSGEDLKVIEKRVTDYFKK